MKWHAESQNGTKIVDFVNQNNHLKNVFSAEFLTSDYFFSKPENWHVFSSKIRNNSDSDAK